MKKLLLAALALPSFSVFAQIEYPGTVTTIGSATTVFDYSTQNCNTIDIPDVPARAFRDASGKINLLASHYTTWRMTGSDFSSLTKDCNAVMTSHQSANASDFNNNEWIMAPYTTDGIKIHAMVHNEFVPCGNWNNCWYNSITYVSSSDSGKTYTHATAPNHLVAASPYKSPYPSTHSPFGIFGGSNIIKKENYYYKMVQVEAHLLQDWGAGLIRTNDLSDPSSWRGWDGSGFNVQFVNPYTATGYNIADKVLAPVSRDNIGKMCASLTYNTYLGKYVVVDFTTGTYNGASTTGFYYSTSDDLINWSKCQYIPITVQSTWAAGGSNYPSIIDPTDTTRNFEQSGQTPYLYYTKWNSGTYDRDLMRIQIQFNKVSVSSFTVTTTGNQADATPGDGVCKIVGGSACTLRAALEESNARPIYNGYDTLSLPINFAISGSGVKTISPSTYLPEVFYPIDINGYTQTGASANTNNFDQGLNTVITILINAANAGGAPALQFHSARNRVRGLAIKDGDIFFTYESGYSTGEGKNSVEGCFIGIAADGTTVYNAGGVKIDHTGGVTVGGTTNAARNLIAGGISIVKGDSNTVIGNYIGTTKTGSAKGGGSAFGVDIQDSSYYNMIGGSSAAARNVISGSTTVGVSIAGSQAQHNSLLGNYIGVAVNGSTGLGNGRSGVILSDSTHDNTIGAYGAGNVIADNSTDEAGIWMDNAYSNSIQSNYIGTDAALTASIGNGVSGNPCAGIVIMGASHDNTIGGWNATEGNVIANNKSHGVILQQGVGKGNALLSNLIYNNDEMGIDIGWDDAPNGNDNMDADSGPNDDQNFPLLDGAYATANDIVVSGTLNSKPNATYKLQYFYNSACDGSGNGEGQTLIGTETVTTNSSGDAGFFKSFNISLSVGGYVSALATDASNSTSEFSLCQLVDAATGMKQVNASVVTIYPTVATENVFMISDKEYSYTLYDQQGKLMMQGNIKTQNSSINISNLSEGLYVLKLQGNNWIDLKKIVKN
jgi:hypothetical protein